MLVGLGLTGATAWLTANTAFGALFIQQTVVNGHPVVGLTMLGLIALFAPLGLVLFLSFRINKMSVSAAQTTFWIYAGLMGIAIAPVLLVYTGASVAEVFFITAATFGAMSLYGYTTQRSLRLGLVPVHGPDRHHHRHGREHLPALGDDAVRDLRDRRADLHGADRL
jgi:FtsH-binding integral membrane protein